MSKSQFVTNFLCKMTTELICTVQNDCGAEFWEFYAGSWCPFGQVRVQDRVIDMINVSACRERWGAGVETHFQEIS